MSEAEHTTSRLRNIPDILTFVLVDVSELGVTGGKVNHFSEQINPSAAGLYTFFYIFY